MPKSQECSEKRFINQRNEIVEFKKNKFGLTTKVYSKEIQFSCINENYAYLKQNKKLLSNILGFYENL